MKKIWNFACFYTVIALIGGVFFREFTKLNSFQGVTTLGVVHTHALVLGLFFFLIVLLLEKQFSLSSHKRFALFLNIYNIGLMITIVMLVIRGITQVLESPLSTGLNAAISGIAGIGHILLGAGLLLFLFLLKSQIKKVSDQ